MKIKMNTLMMPPRLGVLNPGQIIEMPEDEAKPLLEGGNVVESFRGDGQLFETTPAASPVDPSMSAVDAERRCEPLDALQHLRPR